MLCDFVVTHMSLYWCVEEHIGSFIVDLVLVCMNLKYSYGSVSIFFAFETDHA